MTDQTYPDFGQYLTYAQSVRSDTARRKGISNVPTQAQYAAMKLVYEHIYVPICQQFGPLPVSSFFRSATLNEAVGGSSKSQHMRGQAIDIDCDGLGPGFPTNRQLFDWIGKNLSFDQLILEYPDKYGNPGWVHVSFKSFEANRKQTITVS